MIEIRSFRDLLRLLFIFFREFKLAVLVTLVVIVLGAFLMPAKYESNARLLIKPGRDAALPLEISDRQTMVMPISQRDPIVDEERMLTGRPIVKEVAQNYLEVLANQPPPPWVWKRIKFELKGAVGAVFEGFRTVLEFFGIIEEQTEVERLARSLEKNFEVSHALGSSVMEISFTWNDPEVSQAVVQSWIETYQRQRTEALGRKSLFNFYEMQSSASALEIKAYKEQLLQKMEALGAASITERLEDLSERINILNGERHNTIRLIKSSDSVLDNTQKQLASLPAEVVTVRQIALNPAQQDLRRLLNQKHLERADMLRTYTAEAEPVKSLEEAIAALELQIKAEGDTVQSSEDRAPNTHVIHLRRVFLDESSNNKALRSQLEVQDAQLADLRAQRSEAMRAEPEITRLQRELEAAEKNYVLYTDSLEKSRIDRELDKSQISNIAIIEAATLNPSRVFPKTFLMLLLALPFSLLVGLLVVYLCYLLDQRIHDGGLVEERFGLPLWSTLPEIENSAGQHSNSFAASVYRLYGFMPLERIAKEGLTLGLTSARHAEGVSFVVAQIQQLLQENGLKVRIGGEEKAQPGEVVLIDASALLVSREAFVALRRADMIALVIEAGNSTVPVVQHVLSILTTAFGKVDGIIINRRRFEVPERVLQVMDRLRVSF